MARKTRPDWKGALHHIMVRGIDGKAVFQNESDKFDLIGRFAELVPELHVSIYAWAVMPNHLHLLVRTGREPIYKFMQCLLTGFAVSYNLRNDRKGHVFQGRFKSILVQEEIYFIQLIKYIHLNPLKAGIVKNINGLEEYRWCGHGSIMGVRKEPWVNSMYVLSKFGSERDDSISNYLKCISEKTSNKTLETMVHGTYTLGRKGICSTTSESRCDGLKGNCRVLGNKEFAVRTMNWIKQEGNRIARDREDTHDRIAKLFAWVEDNWGFSAKMIQGNTRNPELSDSRALIAWVLSNHLGLSQSDCSGILRMSRSGIRKAISNGKEIFSDSQIIKEISIW